MKIIKTTPVGKPRMTRRDQWDDRPCVTRYRAYADTLRRSGLVDIPESDSHLVFVLPMPASWSKQKKLFHFAQPHQVKPDKDNLEKAVMDAVFSKQNRKNQSDDAHIWHGMTSKFWGYEGLVILGDLNDEIPASSGPCQVFIENLLDDLQGIDYESNNQKRRQQQ